MYLEEEDRICIKIVLISAQNWDLLFLCPYYLCIQKSPLLTCRHAQVSPPVLHATTSATWMTSLWCAALSSDRRSSVVYTISKRCHQDAIWIGNSKIHLCRPNHRHCVIFRYIIKRLFWHVTGNIQKQISPSGFSGYLWLLIFDYWTQSGCFKLIVP